MWLLAHGKASKQAARNQRCACSLRHHPLLYLCELVRPSGPPALAPHLELDPAGAQWLPTRKGHRREARALLKGG